MAIDIDISRLPSGDLSWQRLLAAIESSEPSDETMWLEHKAHLEPSSKAGSAALAKAIVAFANRDPSRSTWLGGYALIVVGLGPGQIPGTAPVDPAILHDKIDRYLAKPTPVWDSTQRAYKGQNILVITVDPPRDGDPIFVIGQSGGDPKAGSQIKDGDIYVRRPGKSDFANAADIRRLEARRDAGSQAAHSLDLSVEVTDEEFSIPWLEPSLDWVDSFLQSERTRLLAPLEPRRPPARPPYAYAAAEQLARKVDLIQKGALRAFVTEREESRSPDDFRTEVDEYLSQAAERLLGAVDQFLHHNARPVVFVARNNTRRNFLGVRVELHIEGSVLGYSGRPEEMKSLRSYTGKPPRPWGPYVERRFPDVSRGPLIPDYTRALGQVSIRPRPIISNGGSVKIVFPVFDLRPEATWDLDEVFLVAEDHFAEAAACSWTATATNVDAVADGQVSIKLDDQPIDPTTQLNEE